MIVTFWRWNIEITLSGGGVLTCFHFGAGLVKFCFLEIQMCMFFRISHFANVLLCSVMLASVFTCIYLMSLYDYRIEVPTDIVF